MYLADKLSLQALALEANGAGQTPGIAPGVHLRLIPSMQLGLPAAPVLVYRVELLEQEAVDAGIFRTGAYLKDGYDMPTALNQPILHGQTTAHIGVGYDDACIYAEVEVSPGSNVEMRAYVPDGVGSHKLVALRNGPPYAISGFGIDCITVRGTGTITSVRFITLKSLLENVDIANRLMLLSPWAIWNLPVKTSKNYLSVTEARKRARDRMFRGAPPHWPYACRMNVEPMAASLDIDRIANDKPLQVELERVLGMKSPRNEIFVDPTGFPVQPQGGPVRSRYRPLAQLLAASTEPSVARWLGLADVDPSMTNPGNLVFYVMRTFWNVDKTNLVPATAYPEQSLYGATGNQLAERLGWSLGRALTGAPDWDELTAERRKERIDIRRILDHKDRQTGYLTVAERFIAAAVRMGAPPERPPNLELTAKADDLWHLDPGAIEPHRVATITVDNMVEGGGIALARMNAQGNYELQNPAGPGGVRVSMIPGLPQGTGTSGASRVLVDGHCPPDKTCYQLAQRDWAGQWSPFVTTNQISAGTRLVPPTPVLEVQYPAPPKQNEQPFTGKVFVQVLLPRGHVPGAYPLSSCNIDLRNASGTILENVLLGFDAMNRTWTVQSAPQDSTTIFVSEDTVTVRLRLPGPNLAPASRQTLKVVAATSDTNGTKTEAEKSVLAVDPRPPIAPPFTKEIRKTSRPDASSLSWLRVELPKSTGVAAYRAYVTDDGVAEKALRAANVLTADWSAFTLQQKANALDGFNANLTRKMFELVGERISVEETASTFVHSIPGSHTGLILLRLVPESAEGSAVEFTKAPLLMFAVPDVRPPAQPGIAVETVKFDVAAGVYVITLRAQFAVGGPPVGMVRLRRTRHAFEDPLRMNIVANAAAPANVSSCTIEDRLPVGAEWSTITWVVEVQGQNDASGTWSPTSAPAQRVIIPDKPPVAPTIVLDPDRKTLHIDHAQALRHPAFVISVAMGDSADERRTSGSLNRDASGLSWSFAQAIAANTKLTVVVFDPRQRRSSAATLLT